MAISLIYYSYTHDLAQLKSNTISTARALDSAIDQHVIGVQAAVATLATSELLYAGNLAEFDKRARAVTINERAATFVLEDASGQKLVNTALPFGSPLPSGASPEIIRAIKMGRATITDFFEGPVLHKKIIAVVVPVMRSGQIIYALSTPIPLDQLRDLLVGQQLPENWIAAVVDANGTIIARTHDHDKFVGVKVRSALFERMTQVNEDAVESVTVEGIPVITVFSRSAKSNLSVVIGIPRAELEGRLHNTLLLLLAGTMLLLAASLWLAWFYAERITRTIHGLKAQALALGQSQKIVPIRADFLEAQQLGLAFEQAAAKLGQANAALVQRNLDLQQFAFVASHDLRSPLRSVKGYLTLLKKRYAAVLDANGSDLIERATRAVDQMDQLTEDLMSYARLDSPAQSFSEVDCNKVLTNTLAFLHASIAQTDAQIEVETLPTVNGDRGQFTQLFQNLLGNALKYCKNCAPKIRVSAQRDTAQWVFEVSDNGIGIEPQHLQRIFEVFKRLHTAQDYPGNGIGLAVCQRIVERHGGKIWAYSKPGEGSTFFFSIPDNQKGVTP